MARLNINGKDYDVDVDPSTPLLWAIRENVGLTGTKYGCGIAQCGACTVHIDGIAKESPIYGIKGADVLNPASDINETREYLQKFKAQGKKVFVNVANGRLLIVDGNREINGVVGPTADLGSAESVSVTSGGILAGDVAYGQQQVRLVTEIPVYTRLSVSQNTLPRKDGTTVFANVKTGRVEIVDKDAVVFPVEATS